MGKFLIAVVSVFVIGFHCFNKFFYIKEPLNKLHAIMRINGKTHLAIMYKPTLEKA